MIKLENIHTDAELLSVFKRLADRLTDKFEQQEAELDESLRVGHNAFVRVKEKVLEEFVAQENVLELPLFQR